MGHDGCHFRQGCIRGRLREPEGGEGENVPGRGHSKAKG